MQAHERRPGQALDADRGPGLPDHLLLDVARRRRRGAASTSRVGGREEPAQARATRAAARRTGRGGARLVDRGPHGLGRQQARGGAVDHEGHLRQRHRVKAGGQLDPPREHTVHLARPRDQRRRIGGASVEPGRRQQVRVPRARRARSRTAPTSTARSTSTSSAAPRRATHGLAAAQHSATVSSDAAICSCSRGPVPRLRARRDHETAPRARPPPAGRARRRGKPLTPLGVRCRQSWPGADAPALRGPIRGRAPATAAHTSRAWTMPPTRSSTPAPVRPAPPATGKPCAWSRWSAARRGPARAPARPARRAAAAPQHARGDLLARARKALAQLVEELLGLLRLMLVAGAGGRAEQRRGVRGWRRRRRQLGNGLARDASLCVCAFVWYAAFV